MREGFRAFAASAADAAGHYWSFMTALGIVLVWILLGPVFHYSDTWQLVINTGTTIITFLMVFLVQNSQNREARVTRLKLDELLRGVEGARTGLVILDHMSDDELDDVEEEFRRLQDKYAVLVDDDLVRVQHEKGKRRHARRKHS